MSENIEQRRKNQLWEGKLSQKGQRKGKSQKIKCWRFEMLQKWVTHDHESVNHPGSACRGKLLNSQSTSHLLQSITNKIVLFCALCHRPPMCCVQNCLQVCPFCAWDTSKPFLESDILGLFRSIVHIEF